MVANQRMPRGIAPDHRTKLVGKILQRLFAVPPQFFVNIPCPRDEISLDLFVPNRAASSALNAMIILASYRTSFRTIHKAIARFNHFVHKSYF